MPSEKGQISGKRQRAGRVGQYLSAPTYLNRPDVSKERILDDIRPDWYNKYSVLEVDQLADDCNDSCNNPVFKVQPSGGFSRKTRKQSQNAQNERECKIKQRELKREN